LGTGYNVSGLIGSESLSRVTLAYATKDVSRDGSGAVQSNKTITVGGAVATSGTRLTDYVISYVNNTVSTITPYVVSLTGTRVYDATTSVDASKLGIGTLVGSETLTLTGVGTLADKNVASSKAVGLGTLALGNGTSGGLGSNYTLVGGGRTVDITRATISSVSGITANNKIYNGNTSAALVTTNAVFNGMFSGDDLNVATSTGVFADSHAAQGLVVSISGITLAGRDIGNYTLVSSTASAQANITPAPLMVAALAQTKVYDGNTTVPSSALGIGYIVSGLIGSESVTGVTLAYATKDVSRLNGVVQSNKTITVGGAVATSGTRLTDYAINYVNNTASTITPRSVSLSASKMFDDTNNLNGFVSVSTGLSGEVLGYAGALAFSSRMEFIGNYISQIQLIDSATALAANYQLPALNAENAPVTIAMATPMKVINPDTYQMLATSNPTPAMAASAPEAVVVEGIGVATPLAPVVMAPAINTAPAVMMAVGRAFVIPIAKANLFNGNAGSQATVKTTLTDGSPLPAWIYYDATQETLVGEAPDNISSLAIKITSVDKDGNSVSTEFVLQFEAKK